MKEPVASTLLVRSFQLHPLLFSSSSQPAIFISQHQTVKKIWALKPLTKSTTSYYTFLEREMRVPIFKYKLELPQRNIWYLVIQSFHVNYILIYQFKNPRMHKILNQKWGKWPFESQSFQGKLIAQTLFKYREICSKSIFRC